MEKSGKIKKTNINKTDKGAGKPKTVHVFWKGISIAFIALFCVILVFGIVRWQHFKPHHFVAQQSQIDLATKAVSDDLSSAGYNLSDYKIQVADSIRGFARDRQNENIIQVSLFGDSKMHQYLVDADSGKIIMHSETTFYDGMKNMSMGFPKQRGFFQGMMPGQKSPEGEWVRQKDGRW